MASESREAGWAHTRLKMEDILRFINKHSAAIHAADTKVLVTSGAWNEWGCCRLSCWAKLLFAIAGILVFLSLERFEILSNPGHSLGKAEFYH